ncbi:MAG: SOS response-associated peptidase family protein [Planctomycetota bacterium]|nr:SOS response-associated peptidase family protein [Planctomycetota bacterium]
MRSRSACAPTTCTQGTARSPRSSTRPRASGTKQPHLIRLLNDPIFCFAGLWDSWQGDGEPAESFTILTTEPNDLVATIHDRMPVIVRPSDFDRCLGEDAPPDSLFDPFPAEEMEAFPVSTRVNSPRNDDPSLVEPIEPGSTDDDEPSLFGPGI